jgi:putative DNA modification/repair radical SAM protein
MSQAGLYADRLSVNIEIPSEESLKLVAPEKDYPSVLKPMSYIHQHFLESKEEKKKYRHAPKYAPAGQSTQMVIGASPENDQQILNLASLLYKKPSMKRVYYSGYIPVNLEDARLPMLSAPPLVRENRLYQADWLMRFYQFNVNEIVNEQYPDLDLELDPKLAYALRHPELFPIDVNTADYELILRIPGVGVKSAKLIVTSRRYGRLSLEHLRKMGVVTKRAKYFISCKELPMNTINEVYPENLRQLFISNSPNKKKNKTQLLLGF